METILLTILHPHLWGLLTARPEDMVCKHPDLPKRDTQAWLTISWNNSEQLVNQIRFYLLDWNNSREQKETWEHIFWGCECSTKGQADTEHTLQDPDPPKPGKARTLSPWAKAGPALYLSCQDGAPKGPIWAHLILCKCAATRSGRILKGQKRGCFTKKSLFLLGCFCLCVSFSVCVGGRHLSLSSSVFLSHSAWAPVPLCLGFHFLSLL